MALDVVPVSESLGWELAHNLGQRRPLPRMDSFARTLAAMVAFLDELVESCLESEVCMTDS